MLHLRIFLFLLFTLVSNAMISIALGQPINNGPRPVAPSEWRIDTDIYTDETKPPLTTIKTILTESQYIEWDDAQGRVTLIEPTRKKITLFDRNKRLMIKVDSTAIEERLDKALAQLGPQQQPAWLNGGEVVLDEAGYFTLGGVSGSTRRIYRIRASLPTDPMIANRYADFANWSVRLSAVYPPYQPPHIRMRANEFLNSQSLFPTEVRRLETYPKGSTEIVARLILNPTLTNEDRNQIADLTRMAKEYKVVSEEEFFSDAKTRAASVPKSDRR